MIRPSSLKWFDSCLAPQALGGHAADDVPEDNRLPLVSAIIPTIRRPHLVVRAVRSALAQTMNDLEVIVVVDGPEPETLAALSAVSDGRLRVLQNEFSLGCARARNKGIDAARGRFIALLDDDDEWAPTKLERQLAAVTTTDAPVVVSCLSYFVTPSTREIWPRRVYDNASRLDEYLFDRRSVFMGEACIPVPSLFIPRTLFDTFKFRDSRVHEDWDLLLRIVQVGRARLVTVPEPLVTVHESRDSLSATTQWTESLAWIDRCRPLVSRRAYAGFCLTVAGAHAARAAAYRGFLPLLYRACRYGAPRPIQLALYVGLWIVPRTWSRRIRAFWYQRRH